jgi:pimeloyl-ACP methyl ester carboxylesterase
VEAYRMGNLSEDVVAMADALGVGAFHLVGHDWGGAVAWVVASRWPGRIETLTVLSTPHYGALTAARTQADSDQARRSAYLQEFAAPDAAHRFLAENAAYLRSVYGSLDPGAVEVYLKALGSPTALRAALAWYTAAFAPASGAGFPAAPRASGPPPVQVPTLYVWSTDDEAFGREAAEATAGFVTGPYRFEVLEGVGHWVAEEAPARVARLLVEHILGQGEGGG